MDIEIINAQQNRETSDIWTWLDLQLVGTFLWSKVSGHSRNGDVLQTLNTAAGPSSLTILRLGGR